MKLFARISSPWPEALGVRSGQLGLAIVAALLVEWICPVLLPDALYDTYYRLALLRLVEAAVLAGLYVRREDGGFVVFGVQSHSFTSGLCGGIIWTGIICAVGLLVLAGLFLYDATLCRALFFTSPTLTGCLSGYILAGLVVAPVTEEVLFRGIVNGFLRRFGWFVSLVAGAFFLPCRIGTAAYFPWCSWLAGSSSAWSMRRNETSLPRLWSIWRAIPFFSFCHTSGTC